MASAIPMVAGGVLGLVKHNQDVGEYNRKKQMAGDLQKYSPWTGMGGESFMPTKAPDLMGSVMQGGMAGASMLGGPGGGAGGLGSLLGGGGAAKGASAGAAPTLYNQPMSAGAGEDPYKKSMQASPWASPSPTMFG